MYPGKCLLSSIVFFFFFFFFVFAGSGAIEFDEFVKMYLTLRTKPMDKGRTIKALFQRLDTDNDGHLQFRYFLFLMKHSKRYLSF